MDPSSDVALLDVEEDDDLTPLEMGDSSKVEVGDPVVAIGNPFGLDRTVTSGIVSAKARQIQAPNGFSISDVRRPTPRSTPATPAARCSTATGRVIGINSQIATQGGGNEGVAFAVPIETAQEVADQLLADGSVERAYLGISGGDITGRCCRGPGPPRRARRDRRARLRRRPGRRGRPPRARPLEGRQPRRLITGRRRADRRRRVGDIITAIDRDGRSPWSDRPMIGRPPPSLPSPLARIGLNAPSRTCPPADEVTPLTAMEGRGRPGLPGLLDLEPVAEVLNVPNICRPLGLEVPLSRVTIEHVLGVELIAREVAPFTAAGRG